MRSSSLLALGGLAVASISAHKGCGGHEIARRNPGGPTIDIRTRGGRKRDNPCSGYNYPGTSTTTSQFPGSWAIANLLPADTEAQSEFAALDAKVRAALPNDLPKGNSTGNGDFSGVTYNGGEDPDCWWSYTGCTSPKAAGLEADVTTVPEPNTYGLTYDDGPNCGNAPLYEWMGNNSVRATLFYIGSNVQNWPLQAINGLEGGHEICVHTWSHHYMTSLTNEQVFAELYYTQKMIKMVLGVTPKCWRPPYGDVDNRVRMFADGLGLKTIVWSDDSADWTLDAPKPTTQATVDGNYQALIDKAKSGGFSTYGPIVLSHELSDATINEALKFLPSLKSAFAHLAPVSVAYNQTNPYVETNYVYPTFEEYIQGNEDPVTTGVASSTSTSASASTSTSSASNSSESRSMTSSGSAAASSASATTSASKNSPSSGTSNANARPSSGAGRGMAVSSVLGGMVGLIAWLAL